MMMSTTKTGLSSPQRSLSVYWAEVNAVTHGCTRCWEWGVVEGSLLNETFKHPHKAQRAQKRDKRVYKLKNRKTAKFHLLSMWLWQQWRTHNSRAYRPLSHTNHAHSAVTGEGPTEHYHLSIDLYVLLIYLRERERWYLIVYPLLSPSGLNNSSQPVGARLTLIKVCGTQNNTKSH